MDCRNGLSTSQILGSYYKLKWSKKAVCSFDIQPHLPDEFEPANIYSNQKINEDIPIEEQLDFLQNLSNQLSEFNLSEKEKDIAEEIVWNLDENGYLSLDIILIADRFNVTENDAEKVLFKVQKLNPPGIGARNLQECLLLQLNKKNQENHRKVIELHFDKFVNLYLL